MNAYTTDSAMVLAAHYACAVKEPHICPPLREALEHIAQLIEEESDKYDADQWGHACTDIDVIPGVLDELDLVNRGADQWVPLFGGTLPERSAINAAIRSALVEANA